MGNTSLLRAIVLGLSLILWCSTCKADPNSVYTRIVDVGAGLCVITSIEDEHYFVYDAGHWHGKKCYEATKEIVKNGTIDLMVLSHSDGDHVGDAAKIIDDFNIKTIIRTGHKGSSGAWRKTKAAVAKKVAAGKIEDINLGTTSNLTPGHSFSLGDARVTFIYGQHEWTATDLEEDERRNAISIVMKLEYEGKSILFPGDTVGRRRNAEPAACADAERIMVNNMATASIDSDVLIAPHHGADNANANCFIKAVSAEYVIFSAGNDYHHPRKAAVKRYLDYGIPVDHLFRTDLGDDEDDIEEWNYGEIKNCIDGKGDDDVEVIIRKGGDLTVRYLDDGNFESCRQH